MGAAQNLYTRTFFRICFFRRIRSALWNPPLKLQEDFIFDYALSRNFASGKVPV